MEHRECRNGQGFTLIETMIALVLAALLLGLAVPAWSNALEAVHAGAARAAMQETLFQAMRHAALAGTDIVVCPGRDACVDTWDWSQGWLSWPDYDGDRRRDADEAVLRREEALPGHVHLRSTTGRRRLVLRPHGGAASGTNVTFTLCDGRGAARAIALALANSGRLREVRPVASAVADCLDPFPPPPS